MNLNPTIRNKHSIRGLTLIEIMVAVTLLIVIMVGLMAMFDQTQKVFVTGLRQTDVLEGGRAAVDLLGRDFEQMEAGGRSGDTNFYAELRPWPTARPAQVLAPDGVGVLKTLTLQDVYFLSHPDDWNGIGYKVLDPNAPNTDPLLMGALYRFGTNAPLLFSTNFIRTFLGIGRAVNNDSLIGSGRLSRVIDGVVHFKVTAYDREGIRFAPTTNFVANLFVAEYLPPPQAPLEPVPSFYEFSGRRLPSTIEVEIGVLEPEAVIRARALPGSGAAYADNLRAFIADNSGKIHLFRQRIPIRVAASFGN
jgi:hypothetical protein